MNKPPLGIKIGQSGTGIYSDENGIEIFETSLPYILTDGKTLMPPLPVHVVSGAVFIDSNGNAQSAIPVRGISPPVDGITWDNNTLWDGGTFWS